MYMRGPGAVPGFMRSKPGMNELSEQLNIDPLQLRLINDAEKDESTNTPFSSRHLKECFEVGRRNSTGTSALRLSDRCAGRQNPRLGLGWASWVALRLPCTASVEFCANAAFACVRHADIGTGTYTIFAQFSARDRHPLDRIDVVLGDSALPDGPMSGGSMVTGSVLNAIAAGADGAIQKLQNWLLPGRFPFQNAKVENVSFTKALFMAKIRILTAECTSLNS